MNTTALTLQLLLEAKTNLSTPLQLSKCGTFAKWGDLEFRENGKGFDKLRFSPFTWWLKDGVLKFDFND